MELASELDSTLYNEELVDREGTDISKLLDEDWNPMLEEYFDDIDFDPSIDSDG